MESDTFCILRIARKAELAHPGLALIEAFLNDAVDGDRAAEYMFWTYTGPDGNLNLPRFVKDWKDLVQLFYIESPRPRKSNWVLNHELARRDANHCCLTQAPCWSWNQCNVFPIIPSTAFNIQEKRLHDMLCAFVSPADQNLLNDSNSDNATQNCWTLSKDAASAFSKGMIRLENVKGIEYKICYNSIGGKPPAIHTSRPKLEWKCNLADHSNSGIPSPESRLFAIHSRFSKAMRWTQIAKDIAKRSSVRQDEAAGRNSIKGAISTVFLNMWSLLPSLLRAQTYRMLRWAGSRFYDSSSAMGVQRLPFGLYLKYGPSFHAPRHTEEFNALTLVWNQTRIPVPRPIDLLLSRNESFLVTSRIEGEPAGIAIDECSDAEMEHIASDLRSYLAQLHSIRRPSGVSKYAICSSTGGPCLDYRISADPVGPFFYEQEFSSSLTLGALPGVIHRTDHKIVFTHGDLSLRNILIRDGRLTGIVDWENAGWFPEYWEYTKCHFSVRFAKRWLKIWEDVFEGKYGEELGIERRYWEYHSAW